MPSEENNNSFFTVYKGLATFVQGTIAVFTKVREWYQNNEENIRNFVIGFADFGTCCSAIKVMAQHQVMFSDDLDFKFATVICDVENVDTLVEEYYFGNNEQRINRVISRCEKSCQLQEYRNLFLQVNDAYCRQHYHLACVGLFAIADGILADVSEMNTTSFDKRIKSIEEKMGQKIELDDIDRRTFFIQIQMGSLGDGLANSIFGFSKFSGNEPDMLNRHWLLHGRTRKTYSRYDFLKILLWIDQLAFLNDVFNAKVGGDEE